VATAFDVCENEVIVDSSAILTAGVVIGLGVLLVADAGHGWPGHPDHRGCWCRGRRALRGRQERCLSEPRQRRRCQCQGRLPAVGAGAPDPSDFQAVAQLSQGNVVDAPASCQGGALPYTGPATYCPAGSGSSTSRTDGALNVGGGISDTVVVIGHRVVPVCVTGYVNNVCAILE